MSKYIDGSGLTYLWSKIKAYIQSLNYTSNTGTVTGITMNNTSYSPVNGDVDIGTVVTDVSDWSQTTTTALDYIKNKPDITQVNSPKTITISGVSNTIVVGDGVSIGRNNSKIEIGSNGGDVDTITLTSNGSDGGVYVSTNVQKFYYNNKEVATKNDIPTVYAWALASTKPSYTAADVGAVPTTRTVNGKALSADITLSASDVSALPSSTVIPSAPGTLNTTATTAQSTNSSEALSGNVTLHKVAKTGAYSDLIGTPTIPTISTDIISDGIDDTKTASPKAVKTFVEGKHYLTSETEPDFNGSAAASITSSDITAWNGKQDALVFNTAYNASSNKVATMSDIPSAVTENTVSGWGFTKNAGTLTGITMNGNSVSITSGVADLGTVITAHQSLANYVQKSNTSGLLKSDGTVDQNVYLTTETEPAYTQSAAATLTSSNIVKGTSQSYNIWSGTQQEYDAITTKDNNTLYFIKES